MYVSSTINRLARCIEHNAPINCLPHYPPLGLHVGNTGDLTQFWTKDMPLGWEIWPSIDPLTFDLLEYSKRVQTISPPNPLSGTRARRGFDHLTCLNGEVFDHLFGQIPTHCPRGGIVGPTNDRCISISISDLGYKGNACIWSYSTTE